MRAVLGPPLLFSSQAQQMGPTPGVPTTQPQVQSRFCTPTPIETTERPCLRN
jgi:hypothetical protein